MSLSLYNSLTKRIEPFRPRKGRLVRMYTCGPTVYDYAHIGNLRTYVFEDVLKRALQIEGYRVRHVMNITDVGHLTDDADEGEDKLERAATRQRRSAKQLAAFYTRAFLKDLKRLAIGMPDELPRATGYIDEQIALVRRLERRGHTYTVDDGVYFDTTTFPTYGRAFGGQRQEAKRAGARVATRMGKRHPQDFALWKLTPHGVKRQQEWDSPWGRGFPGWHLECSTMAATLLRQPFEIHCGGIDHIPIHHTNEIAQSEAAYGKPLADVWCHGAFLTVDGKRMGKSEGNLVTIDTVVEQGFHPLAYRYLVLGAHYRSSLNFTWESLAAAQHALEHLWEYARALPKPSPRAEAIDAKTNDLRDRFRAAIENDLDMPAALAVLWEATKAGIDAHCASALLAEFDRVFGLDLAAHLGRPLRVPKTVRDLVAAREHARKSKDWARADVVRAQLGALGWSVEDTNDGPRIRRRTT